MAVARISFQQELEKLQKEVLHMGEVVDRAMASAMESLVKRDLQLAETVIQGDQVIDDLELAIEQECLKLLALQQPMAIDLRTIGTMLKIVTDLERMGDHATDIARAVRRMGQNPPIKPLVDIPRMAEIGRHMLQEGLKAFIERDVERALAMAREDDQLDHLFKQVFRELLLLMIANPAVIEEATQLILVAASLERVGDHCTNLAEWTIYMVTGERRDLNL
ncbi:MAG: phosphate signaling complex protein PhoU [Clostridiales bacterium]|nr:phosphate signaling complex protein PhoU [Clostridiales bacterium]